jgi:hypothetical protein
MNTDVEDLLRDGMERFTEEVRAPAGLAGGAGRLHRQHRRRLAARATVACGAAAAIAAGATFAASGGSAGSGAAQARTVAYVTKHVENALASENLVFVGRSDGNFWGTAITWAYGNRNRFETFTNSGRPYWASGTALVDGKLTYTYVTYFDHRYSLSPLASPPASACSTNVALSMGGPMIPTTAADLSAFIDATLACAAATVNGHVKIDGVETTEIIGKPVTVKLSAGYAKTVHEKRATARWRMYVNPTTYLPVRMYGSTEAFGGKGGSTLSSSVTNVRWLPATPANTAKALVTIPPGFHRFYGLAGNQ